METERENTRERPTRHPPSYHGLDTTMFSPISLPGFLLSVMTPSGRVMKIVVQSGTPISHLKQILEHEGAGVKASRIRLMVRNEEMQNDKRLGNYGITGDSVIRMEVS